MPLYFCLVVSSSMFLFSSTILSRRTLDVYNTSTRGVAFRIQVWNMLHSARWKYRTQKWRKKSPSAHHRTTLSGYIFAAMAHVDNHKKEVLKQQYLPTCPHSMVNVGPRLAAKIGSLVWGIPAHCSDWILYCDLWCISVASTGPLLLFQIKK